jgi:cytochrome c
MKTVFLGMMLANIGFAAEMTKAMIMKNVGVGPVTKAEFDENFKFEKKLNITLAKKGKAIHAGKCATCHKLSKKRHTGPSLLGVTARRNPVWIMNMVLNPTEMIKKDPIAKKLLAKYLTPMALQFQVKKKNDLQASKEDVRAIMEYYRYVYASYLKKKRAAKK